MPWTRLAGRGSTGVLCNDCNRASISLSLLGGIQRPVKPTSGNKPQQFFPTHLHHAIRRNRKMRLQCDYVREENLHHVQDGGRLLSPGSVRGKCSISGGERENLVIGISNRHSSQGSFEKAKCLGSLSVFPCRLPFACTSHTSEETVTTEPFESVRRPETTRLAFSKLL